MSSTVATGTVSSCAWPSGSVLSSNSMRVFKPSTAVVDATAVVHCAVQSSKHGSTAGHTEGSDFEGKTMPNLAVSKPAASTSAYKGVTKHRSTGKFEAHLWDSSHVRTIKKKGGRTRGKQIYLGGYDSEQAAARAYDVASFKFWGDDAKTNFPKEQYATDISENASLARLEVVAKLKRNSTGFSRGESRYRGVTRHHQQGRWEARIGRIDGNKYIYLGTFTCEKAAARAYDKAALRFRGHKAVTNFGMGSFADEADESESSSSAASFAACSLASSSRPLGHDSISHSASSSVAGCDRVSQDAALSGADKRCSSLAMSRNARTQRPRVASASFPSSVLVQQQQQQQEPRQAWTSCTTQNFDGLCSHAANQHCSGSSVEYADSQYPQHGWAFRSAANSNAEEGPSSEDDPSSEDIASNAAFVMSEVALVSLATLGDDLFEGLSWDSTFSDMQPMDHW